MRDKTRRHENLLNAARYVFARKGYHTAKVEDIAKQAKVAKGTFYLYFKDKRSVFAELINRVMVAVQSAILRVDTAGDVESQVKHNIRAIIGLFLDDPDMLKLLLSQLSGVDREFQQRIDNFNDLARSLLQVALREGQRLGIVAEGDPRLYACFAIGALREVLPEALASNRNREEIVTALYGALTTGFLRTDPRVIYDPPVRKQPLKRIS